MRCVMSSFSDLTEHCVTKPGDWTSIQWSVCIVSLYSYLYSGHGYKVSVLIYSILIRIAAPFQQQKLK